MKHRVSLKKLSKTPAHRKAMMRNMLVALFREERIKTTFAKAKVLRRFAERLVTRARKDGVHNRRMARKWVQDKAVLNKLFTEIGPRYVQRPGGYTRIVKIGPRYGDASEMVYIALVVDESHEKVVSPKKTQKKARNSQEKSSVEDKEGIDAVEQSADAEPGEKEKAEQDGSLNVSQGQEDSEVKKEQKVLHEQPKHTSRSMHSTVTLQKVQSTNTVQQKAQRYRSDKGK